MVGKNIFQYKILEKLGEGGMGVVYKAQDSKLDRLVALKFLPKQFSVNQEEKSRFIHEARAAAALDHPNICSVFEINETEEGQMFIAMGYYEGKTLKGKIERGPLKIEEAIKIAIQIAEGLGKAHKRDIIHRDIKSANIILTDEGVVKILDFGLAKLKGYTKLTKEGTTMGTVSYMSPEQAVGEEVDRRSDIWSLGVVLYEMVTGQLPFKGEYEQAIMYAIANDEPEPITGLRTGLPMELERIINKILSKDPSERYQHMDDLTVDLRKLKKDTKPEVGTVRKKAGPEITRKPSRKMFVPVSIFLAALLIIVAYFLFRGKSEPSGLSQEPGGKPSIAIVYFENNSGDNTLDHWRNALAELLTTDLSQSKFIKVLRSDQIYGIFKKLNLLEARRYSEQDLSDIARNGRVSHILRGSYLQDGNLFVITSMLVNARTGQTISSFSVRAETGHIIPLVDDITRQIKSKLNLAQSQINIDKDRNIGDITTSSPEAYSEFLEGMNHHQKADYIEASKHFKRAVEIDPEFALAYRFLAQANYNSNNRIEYDRYIQEAMKFLNRVSERTRYQILGTYYSNSDKTYDRAIKEWQNLLKEYPDDSMGLGNLSGIYNRLEEWENTIKLLEPAIGEDAAYWTYWYLAEAYNSLGLYDKSMEILNQYLKRDPEHQVITELLIATLIMNRQFGPAKIELDEILARKPTSYFSIIGKFQIYLFVNDFEKARQYSRKFLDLNQKETRINGLINMGCLSLTLGKIADTEKQLKKARGIAEELDSQFLLGDSYFLSGISHLASGRHEHSLQEFDKAFSSYTAGHPIKAEIRISKEPITTLYFKALTLLKMNRLNQARQAEKKLHEYTAGRQNKKLIRWHHLYLGQKAMTEKNYSKALDYFIQALSLLDHQNYQIYNKDYQAIFFDSAARVHFLAHNLDQAIEWYEKITTLTSGRLYFGDIYARAFFNLGEIYRQKGWKGKAIENYNKFINLWKNCDPIFQPLVEDARKRLNELQTNQ